MTTVSFPQSTLILLLVGVGLCGAAFYDLAITLIRDQIIGRYTARRNFPVRLVVYGLTGVVIAGVWIFMMNWIPGVILIVGAILAIIGVIWYSSTHSKAN
ncbi:hypothetical protein A3A66_04765 [Microgenomates group bacterium RIFCSPLOWO2_01_FULL_46_13]|nr:MAG: hypothetical protein A3A66_04765 [Microgenomates group bacterium RIFCSPLOWO2_01_FULL_46_13]